MGFNYEFDNTSNNNSKEINFDDDEEDVEQYLS